MSHVTHLPHTNKPLIGFKSFLFLNERDTVDSPNERRAHKLNSNWYNMPNVVRSISTSTSIQNDGEWKRFFEWINVENQHGFTQLSNETIVPRWSLVHIENLEEKQLSIESYYLFQFDVNSIYCRQYTFSAKLNFFVKSRRIRSQVLLFFSCL